MNRFIVPPVRRGESKMKNEERVKNIDRKLTAGILSTTEMKNIILDHLTAACEEAVRGERERIFRVLQSRCPECGGKGRYWGRKRRFEGAGEYEDAVIECRHCSEIKQAIEGGES